MQTEILDTLSKTVELKFENGDAVLFVYGEPVGAKIGPEFIRLNEMVSNFQNQVIDQQLNVWIARYGKWLTDAKQVSAEQLRALPYSENLGNS